MTQGQIEHLLEVTQLGNLDGKLIESLQLFALCLSLSSRVVHVNNPSHPWRPALQGRHRVVISSAAVAEPHARAAGQRPCFSISVHGEA